MTRLTIVMPVYNVETYLSKAIESILMQTYKDFELIIVDDGSKDFSSAIYSVYAESDQRIKVVVKDNGGVSSARNVGIKMAEGQYIGFVDADDWIEADMYEKIISEMEQDKSVDIGVGCYVRDVANTIGNLVFMKNDKQFFNKKQALQCMFEQKIYSWEVCDKVYKRSLFNKVLFNENIIEGEDLLINWALFNKARKILYTPVNKYHYYRRLGSATQRKFSEDRLTYLEVLDKVDKEASFIDIELGRIVKKRYITQIIRFIEEMYFEDEIYYREKIEFYQKIIRDNLNFIFNERTFSDKEKEKADVISQSNKSCRNYFEEKYQNIKKFCDSYNNIYIYGIGMGGQHLATVFNNRCILYKSFLVSNSQDKPDKLFGHDVLYISDLNIDNCNNGIILALTEKNMQEVIPVLKQYKHLNIYINCL